MLSPQTRKLIEGLADEMAGLFTPPELIAGCEVLAIGDKDQYASNNGWIEARVGQHNRQRCRWRGQFNNVQVGNFVDVLFFASYRLFVVFGQGGTGAAAGPMAHNLLSANHPDTLAADVVAGDLIIGNATPKWARLPKDTDGQVLTLVGGLPAWAAVAAGGWPFANILTVSTTDPDADYATIAAALAAAGASKTIALDSETFVLGAATISPSASVQTLRGLDGETSTLITSSINDAPLLDINQIGMNVIDIRMTHSGAGTTSGILQTNSDSTLLRNLTLTKTSGAPTTAYGIRIIGGSSTGTTMRDCVVSVVAGTNKYALLIDTAASVTVIDRGVFNGTTADIRVNHAGATVYLLGPRLIGGGLSVAAGTVKGWYYDANGNIIFVDGSGHNSGVWLVDESALLKTKEATLAAAITAAASSGDTIKLDTDTYTITSTLSLGKSLTIEGDGPEATIIDFTGSNQAAFDFDTDSTTIIFRNLTAKHTGGGTAATVGFSNNTVTVILDNAQFLIPSGDPTDARALWIEAGTWELRNGAKAKSTSGTGQYGIYVDAGSPAITIGAGCEVGGATADVYGDQTGSSLNIYGGVITHNLINFAGTIERSGNNSFERGRPNPIINGAFQVWQRGVSFAAIADAAYSADRWIYGKVGAVVHTVTRDTNVPTVAQAGYLVPYSIKLDVTTVDASIAAGDYCTIGTKVEGYNWQFLAQRQFTLSFWVSDTKTGIHCVSFRNSGSDRSYVAEYTVNAADTWEYKTITVTPSPAAGTWDYTTGVGIWVNFALSCGSTFQTTAGAWQTGNYLGTSNQVNATDNTANNFYLAGVKLEPGAIATPFILPDIGSERARCQRYYIEFDFIGFGGTWLNTTTALVYITFPVPMRIAPTATILDTSPDFVGISPTTGGVSTFTGSSSAIAAQSLAVLGGNVQINGFTGATAGQFAAVRGTQIGTSWLGVSAEL